MRRETKTRRKDLRLTATEEEQLNALAAHYSLKPSQVICLLIARDWRLVTQQQTAGAAHHSPATDPALEGPHHE